MKVTITIPELRIHALGSRTRDLRTVKRRRPQTARPVIRVSAQSVVRNISMKPAPPKGDSRQDFQSTEASQPPRIPMTTVLMRQNIDDGGGDTEGAGDALLPLTV
jgi:hypothetical protein